MSARVWSATKAVYSSLIAQSIRWEIAESFFNSLTRRVFATEGVDQAIEFVDTDFDAPPSEHEAGAVPASIPAHRLPDLLADALTDADGAGFCARLLERSRPRGGRRGRRRISWQLRRRATRRRSRFSVSVFYRGRGAYLVGRDQWRVEGDAARVLSAASATRGGLTLDAVLIGEGDLAILFSYTRAYFRVVAPSPYELVQWLRALMPGKRVADLYNAIGYNRHAKTEFYRDFVRHLQQSRRLFRRGGRRARDGDARLHAAELRRRFQTDPRPV